MSDARGLLDRISAFRQRLEAATRVGTEAGAAATSAVVTEPEAFRQSLRQIAGPGDVAEGPALPQLTDRARQSVKGATALLDRHRAFTTDPVVAGLGIADERGDSGADSLVAYHRETTAVLNSAVRLAQVFPESPSLQLKMCDGLDGVLEIVRERLTVQERALAQRRTDFERIDRLAAVYTYYDGKGLGRFPDKPIVEGTLVYSADYPVNGPRKLFSGGAGLCGTAMDYARFCQMMLGGGKLGDARILSRKSVELMSHDQLGKISPDTGFGLGFGIDGAKAPLKELGSAGSFNWGGFYYTSFEIDPKEDMIIISMAQLHPTGDISLEAQVNVLAYQALADQAAAPELPAAWLH